MRFASLLIAITMHTTIIHGATIATVGVDKLELELPYLPTTATATMRIGSHLGPDIVWNIGTFGIADAPTTVILTRSTTNSFGIDWDVLQSYLLGTVTYTKTIDAGPLFAQAVYQWPLPGSPNPRRDYLQEVQFTLDHFITETVNNVHRGYIAGTFTERYIIVPEPRPLVLVCLAGVLVVLSFVVRSATRHD